MVNAFTNKPQDNAGDWRSINRKASFEIVGLGAQSPDRLDVGGRAPAPPWRDAAVAGADMPEIVLVPEHGDGLFEFW